tara:strand:+ start:42 stop:227 length:186 start_codon:yes stop_codon:yes gene_type:complete
MEVFILTERITKEQIRIEAIKWEIENYQHTFYTVNELGNSIVVKSYSTRYFDLTDRYEIQD